MDALKIAPSTASSTTDGGASDANEGGSAVSGGDAKGGARGEQITGTYLQ